ncbi:hypothetical protein HK101_010055 [Irineochytrium annulatum]|nr:hypothetical protein HK101_010055 [Irineochytrium annulatum]
MSSVVGGWRHSRANTPTQPLAAATKTRRGVTIDAPSPKAPEVAMAIVQRGRTTDLDQQFIPRAIYNDPIQELLLREEGPSGRRRQKSAGVGAADDASKPLRKQDSYLAKAPPAHMFDHPPTIFGIDTSQPEVDMSFHYKRPTAALEDEGRMVVLTDEGVDIISGAYKIPLRPLPKARLRNPADFPVYHPSRHKALPPDFAPTTRHGSHRNALAAVSAAQAGTTAMACAELARKWDEEGRACTLRYARVVDWRKRPRQRKHGLSFRGRGALETRLRETREAAAAAGAAGASQRLPDKIRPGDRRGGPGAPPTKVAEAMMEIRRQSVSERSEQITFRSSLFGRNSVAAAESMDTVAAKVDSTLVEGSAESIKITVSPVAMSNPALAPAINASLERGSTSSALSAKSNAPKAENQNMTSARSSMASIGKGRSEGAIDATGLLATNSTSLDDKASGRLSDSGSIRRSQASFVDPEEEAAWLEQERKAMYAAMGREPELIHAPARQPDRDFVVIKGQAVEPEPVAISLESLPWGATTPDAKPTTTPISSFGMGIQKDREDRERLENAGADPAFIDKVSGVLTRSNATLDDNRGNVEHTAVSIHSLAVVVPNSPSGSHRELAQAGMGASEQSLDSDTASMAEKKSKFGKMKAKLASPLSKMFHHHHARSGADSSSQSLSAQSDAGGLDSDGASMHSVDPEEREDASHRKRFSISSKASRVSRASMASLRNDDEQSMDGSVSSMAKKSKAGIKSIKDAVAKSAASLKIHHHKRDLSGSTEKVTVSPDISEPKSPMSPADSESSPTKSKSSFSLKSLKLKGSGSLKSIKLGSKSRSGSKDMLGDHDDFDTKSVILKEEAEEEEKEEEMSKPVEVAVPVVAIEPDFEEEGDLLQPVVLKKKEEVTPPSVPPVSASPPVPVPTVLDFDAANIWAKSPPRSAATTPAVDLSRASLAPSVSSTSVGGKCVEPAATQPKPAATAVAAPAISSAASASSLNLKPVPVPAAASTEPKVESAVPSRRPSAASELREPALVATERREASLAASVKAAESYSSSLNDNDAVGSAAALSSKPTDAGSLATRPADSTEFGEAPSSTEGIFRPKIRTGPRPGFNVSIDSLKAAKSALFSPKSGSISGSTKPQSSESLAMSEADVPMPVIARDSATNPSRSTDAASSRNAFISSNDALGSSTLSEENRSFRRPAPARASKLTEEAKPVPTMTPATAPASVVAPAPGPFSSAPVSAPAPAPVHAPAPVERTEELTVLAASRPKPRVAMFMNAMDMRAMDVASEQPAPAASAPIIEPSLIKEASAAPAPAAPPAPQEFATPAEKEKMRVAVKASFEEVAVKPSEAAAAKPAAAPEHATAVATEKSKLGGSSFVNKSTESLADTESIAGGKKKNMGIGNMWKKKDKEVEAKAEPKVQLKDEVKPEPPKSKVETKPEVKAEVKPKAETTTPAAQEDVLSAKVVLKGIKCDLNIENYELHCNEKNKPVKHFFPVELRRVLKASHDGDEVTVHACVSRKKGQGGSKLKKLKFQFESSVKATGFVDTLMRMVYGSVKIDANVGRSVLVLVDKFEGKKATKLIEEHMKPVWDALDKTCDIKTVQFNEFSVANSLQGLKWDKIGNVVVISNEFGPRMCQVLVRNSFCLNPVDLPVENDPVDAALAIIKSNVGKSKQGVVHVTGFIPKREEGKFAGLMKAFK